MSPLGMGGRGGGEMKRMKDKLTLYVVFFQVNSLQHWDEISTTLPRAVLCPSQNISS